MTDLAVQWKVKVTVDQRVASCVCGQDSYLLHGAHCGRCGTLLEFDPGSLGVNAS
jgi:hypothetical protein